MCLGSSARRAALDCSLGHRTWQGSGSAHVGGAEPGDQAVSSPALPRYLIIREVN